MPYFVYKIAPPRQPEHLETVETYQAARAAVRSRRQAELRATGVEYRLIFAREQGKAEARLSTQRDERLNGED